MVLQHSSARLAHVSVRADEDSFFGGMRQCRGKITCLVIISVSVTIHCFLYYLTLNAQTGYHASLRKEPVDVVYMFVNGSDPAHQAVVQQLTANHTSLGIKAANSARWRDWGELRYSVRSLFRHMPWFRHVYFVLSNNSTQVPTWLNTSHPRVRIISHSQIFPNPTRDLPTVSSRSIEASLHRIQNLSSRFIVMNDDFFIWRTLSRSVLFPGSFRHYICLESSNAIDERTMPTAELTARQESVLHVNKLLNERYGYKRRRDDCHAPQVVNVKLMQQLQDIFPAEFAKVYERRTRSGDTIAARSFYNQWVLQTQPSFEPVSRFWSLMNALSFRITSSTLRNRIYFMLARLLRPQFVAVNDDVDDDAANMDELMAQFRKFCEATFPTPSPIEIIER